MTLRFIERLRELEYVRDVVLSDIWGVLHTALEAFPAASVALHKYRGRGGTVILITNAPRPADSVQRQLRKLGIADETYDAIVSSGDLTRHYVADHPGRKVFWLGPQRDYSIHRGLDPVLAPLQEADYIGCTGLLDDETETAEDYRGMMLKARERKLTLICANPDIVVERGDRLIYCAGAIAELYRELGGEVIFYGKPHRPIYERAMALAGERQGHRIDLGLQRRRVERLDDVVVHAGLLGRDHVLGLGFRRDHDEGRGGEVGIGPHFAQQVITRHRLHVPVGDHEPVLLAAHLVQRRRTVAGIIDILEAKLLQQIPDDTDHGAVVIHHQNR